MRSTTSTPPRRRCSTGRCPRRRARSSPTPPRSTREAERSLIKKAKRTNHQQLRDEAQKAKAAADPDPAATHRRIHGERRLGRHTDARGRLEPARPRHRGRRVDHLAASSIGSPTRSSRTKGKAGTRECRDAYAFDALTEMARRSSGLRHGTPADGRRRRSGSSAAPQHLALLRLDVEALWRGYVEGDELCEVTGLGPIPVEIAKALLGDAVLKLIITKGVDVLNVTSLTRGPTQAMHYAKLWTSPICIVEGCTRTIVEHDHVWGAEYKDTRHTRLDELDALLPHAPRPPHPPRLGARRRHRQAPDGRPRRPPPPRQRPTRCGHGSPRAPTSGRIADRPSSPTCSPPLPTDACDRPATRRPGRRPCQASRPVGALATDALPVASTSARCPTQAACSVRCST